MYGHNPCTLLNLVLMPTITKFSWEADKRAEEIEDLYTKVGARIERKNELARLKPTRIESRSLLT